MDYRGVPQDLQMGVSGHRATKIYDHAHNYVKLRPIFACGLVFRMLHMPWVIEIVVSLLDRAQSKPLRCYRIVTRSTYG